MLYSHKKVKFLLNIFPPLLFSRVKITSISKDFRAIDVRLKRSWMNRNFQKSTFGGSIFSAGDPYYPLMYWQIFARESRKTQVWLKSAEINYLQPAFSHLYYRFRLSDADIELARQSLEKEGRFERWHSIEAVDSSGIACARLKNLVYIRSH